MVILSPTPTSSPFTGDYFLNALSGASNNFDDAI
jgi:hypothetical protein